jgi:hypothetical protein
MEQQLLSQSELENEEELEVREWRTMQLHRLGVPRLLAEEFADEVDWHEVEDLVRRGCSALLAVEIAR